MAAKHPSPGSGKDPKPKRKRKGDPNQLSIPGLRVGEDKVEIELGLGQAKDTSQPSRPSRDTPQDEGNGQPRNSEAIPDEKTLPGLDPHPDSGFSDPISIDDVPPTVRAAYNQAVLAGAGFQPRPPGADWQTVGVFGGDILRSGVGDRSVASDLIPPSGMRPLTRPDGTVIHRYPSAAFDHPESIAASRMRASCAEHGEIVVDNTPCGSRVFDSDDPRTCDRLLPKMLRPGQKLTVWSTIDGGSTWVSKTYVGTGTLIRPGA